MRNLNLKRINRTSSFRKMAMGTWKRPSDPSVYGALDIDMSACMEFLNNGEEVLGQKVTPGHLVGKAIAHCLKVRPELNGLIRGSRLYLRDSVTLFYQVNIPGGRDGVEKANLSGVTIENAEEKSTVDLSKELAEKANMLREGRDKVLQKNMNLFHYIPWAFTRLYLNLGSWIMYGLNFDARFLGLPKDPFGSVMITNVGSLGIDRAWVPLVPYSRVPLILAVGEVTEKAVVIEGEVAIRPLLTVNVTFDHRFVDGSHAAAMAKEFKKCFANPRDYLL